MSDEKKNDKIAKDDDVMGLDDDGSDEQLKLLSQEQEAFVVSKEVAMMSELVRTMVEGGEYRY